MKLNKLLPTLSILATTIACTSMVGCGQPKSKYIAIPHDWLIRDSQDSSILVNLIPTSEVTSFAGYNQIVIPKDIKTIASSAIAKDDTDRTNAIVDITIENNSSLEVLKTTAINNLSNLESIKLPNSITKLEQMCITQCPNLKEIDLSEWDSCSFNQDTGKSLKENTFYQIADKGTIYFKTEDIAKYMKSTLGITDSYKNWEFKVK